MPKIYFDRKASASFCYAVCLQKCSIAGLKHHQFTAETRVTRVLDAAQPTYDTSEYVHRAKYLNCWWLLCWRLIS